MKTTVVARFALSVPLLAAAASASTIHVPGDQPTIQIAVNSANPGDEVVVSPGTYHENVLFDAKDQVTLRGKGDVKIIGSGVAPALYVSEDTHCVVKHLKLAGTGNTVLLCSDSANVEIADLVVSAAAQTGIGTADGYAIRLHDCVVHGGAPAIRVRTSATLIEACRVDGASGDAFDVAAINVVVHGCAVTDTDGNGISIGAPGATTKRVLVEQNRVTNCGIDGVRARSGALNCTIRGNTIARVLGSGIELDSSALEFVVCDNAISRIGGDGIDVSADDATISNNSVKRASSNGVILKSFAQDDLIVRNRCTRSGAFGFRIEGDAGTIISNVAQKSATDAVLAGGANNAYLDNSFTP